MVPSSYCKQPDGPFNALEIIREAALTDILRLHYIWCPVRILQITNSQMVHLMHWRSSEGPLWLMYWGYTYIWCTVRVLHITAFHWCEILTKKLGGPLIILQTAGWTIQCTGDHQRGHFDWHTEVIHIYDVLLESCTSQLFIDVRYWPRSLVVPSSYCKQLDGPFNAPEIIGGAALTDIQYWDYCQNPAYHKQPDDPFNALRIIEGAAFTDILRLDIYMMYCWIPAHHSFSLM